MKNEKSIQPPTLFRQEQQRLLAEITLWNWRWLHRQARVRNVHKHVQLRILALLKIGIFKWCRTLKTRMGKSVGPNEASIEGMLDLLAEMSLRHIAAQLCFTISVLGVHMDRLWELGSKQEGRLAGESGRMMAGYYELRSALRRLLNTDVLLHMPVIVKIHEWQQTRFTKLATTLINEHTVLTSIAAAKEQDKATSELLRSAAALSLFDGIRELNHTDAPRLAAWLVKQTENEQQGFFATIGTSIHQLAVVGKKLRSMRARTNKRTAKWRALTHAIQAAEICIIKVLRTEILMWAQV